MIDDGAALDRMLNGAETDPRTYLLRLYPDASIPELDRVAEDAPALPAEVQRGVWIVRCPCPTRRGMALRGGLLWLRYPLVWCLACANAAAGGLWRRVAVPAERAAIERVLLARPNPENRNWRTHESVADLERQNIRHGCPLEVA